MAVNDYEKAPLSKGGVFPLLGRIVPLNHRMRRYCYIERLSMNDLRSEGMQYNFVNGLTDSEGDGRYRMLGDPVNQGNEV